MATHGKRYLEAAKLVEPGRVYEPLQAMTLLKQTSAVKFEPTVEAHIRLGVDPRHADQMVRGTISLPYGTGKRRTWPSSRRATRPPRPRKRPAPTSWALRISSRASRQAGAVRRGSWPRRT